MISLILCAGALLGIVCVGACCVETRSRQSYEYHQYLYCNKKAPPTLEDWTRFL